MLYLRFFIAASSKTYSTGVSTPLFPFSTFSRKATVRSDPGMYSSTSTPAGKRCSCFSTSARRRPFSSTTDSWVMPFDEPSKLGLTISGKRQPSVLRSASSSTNWPLGEITPCSRSISLVSDLSSETASTQASEPV